MPFYQSNVNEGLIEAASQADGYSIALNWTVAYPDNKIFKIAYHIYYSTIEDNVFTEGVKYISFDGYTEAVIIDLIPGQLYHFAVRAIEYNPVLINYNILPLIYPGLVIYPTSLLSADITATSTNIPLIDASEFPMTGIIKVGAELISYSSKSSNSLILTSAMLQRGFYDTKDLPHTVDGYDGYSFLSPVVSFWASNLEEQNTRIFPCQCRFDWPNYSFLTTDGYKQQTVDLLTTDLSASDAFNVGFNSYDYASYHMTDPVQLLNGVCVGSYIGGELYCADDNSGIGRQRRGLNLQERMDQREEFLLNVTGEPVNLIQRQWTGIVCNCYLPSSEYPDDRCPNCFAEGTLIKTENGFKPIETINIGDKVLSSDGKYYRVKQIFKNKFDGYLNAITTTTTAEPILATDEHPFMVLRGSHKMNMHCGPNSGCKAFIYRGDGMIRNGDGVHLEYGKWLARITKQDHNRIRLGVFASRQEAVNVVSAYIQDNFIPGHILDWDDAKNIKEKDWLVNKWNKNIIDIETIKIPQEFLKNTILGEKRLGVNQFCVNEEFLWILGLYIAEGSCNKRSISFALHKKEADYQNRVINFFTKYGYHPKLRKSSENGIVIEVHSTTLAKWFPKLLGRGCSNKKIPEQFMSLPNNKLWALFSGIYDGDGSKQEHSIGQTSKILALQMVEILQRNGKQPSIWTSQHSKLTPKGNKRKLCYNVIWEEDTINRVNRAGHWQYFDELLTKVKDVKKVDYSGYVYNLEVEGDHTYVVQNILVHNCFGTKFVLGWSQYFNPRRSDRRILMRFSPVDDDVKSMDSGLESEMNPDAWTLVVPTIKDRDVIVRYSQDGNEEFRYEVLSVNRNRTIMSLNSQSYSGAQKLKLQRVRKMDPIYKIDVYPDTSMFPTIVQTSTVASNGIPAHSHALQQNENGFQNQLTGVTAGHNHQAELQNGQLVILPTLGHSHTFP